MSIVLVGISHHKAPVELRERAALDSKRAGDLARTLAGDNGEAVCLSTCNRTELYLADESADAAEEKAEAALLALESDLGPALYRLRGDAAALHLFRVAAGLDSMIPGEGEILGQVRAAHDGGAAGPLLDRLFRQALQAGRKARTQTAIGESPASVSSAAAALAEQVFGDLRDRSILVIGAGKTGELAIRNLVSRGARSSSWPRRARGAAHGTSAAGSRRSRASRTSSRADIVLSSTEARGLGLRANGWALPAKVAALFLIDSPCRGTPADIRGSAVATSTTSTTSKRWSRRLWPAAAVRPSAPRRSSPKRRTDSVRGRRRSKSSRRSPRCVRAPNRFATQSFAGRS
jgi:glutamyl-tRNA reductase